MGLCLFAALSTCQGEGDFKLSHRQLRALKTSFSEKLLDASTRKSDAVEYKEHDAAYKPVKTKSFCFTEVSRDDCADIGGNNVTGPIGERVTSHLACCLETYSGQPISGYEAEHEMEEHEEEYDGYGPGYQKASASSYGPDSPYIDYGKDYDLVLPYGEDFVCNLKFVYNDKLVKVSNGVFLSGSATATCYFNGTAEDCSDVKDGTIITADLEVFFAQALSKEPYVAVPLLGTCNATSTNNSRIPEEMRVKLASVLGNDVKLQGYDDESDSYRSPIHYPGPGSRLYGAALIASGPITSVTNLQHKTEFKSGVMQFVPFFFGSPIQPFMVIPPDTPMIKPGSFKIVLAEGKDY